MPEHFAAIEPCPFLPIVDEPLRAASMKECGPERGEPFFELALRCAQSLWCQGLPAQSILLLNRAFSADLNGTEEVLTRWQLPYKAMVWVMRYHREEDFIGNPRRHFQHLATRMVEPRKDLRSWRAWGCWWYSCQVFPDFPADEKQLNEEGVVEPTLEEIANHLQELGIPGEEVVWREASQVL